MKRTKNHRKTETQTVQKDYRATAMTTMTTTSTTYSDTSYVCSTLLMPLNQNLNKNTEFKEMKSEIQSSNI